MVDFELSQIVPFIGFGVAIVMPLLLKRIDFGKASRDRQEQEIEKLEERLRKCEGDVIRLGRNNHR